MFLTRSGRCRAAQVLVSAGVAAAALGSAHVCPAAPPTVTVTLSNTEFCANDPLTVGIRAGNPDGNPAADLYLGVLLPERVTAVFFREDGGISGPITVSDVARFSAFRSAPPGFSLDIPSFLSGSIPPGIAPGTYRFFALLVRQGSLVGGTFEFADLLALDLKPFTFSPGNVFLPFFRKPFDGEFTLSNPLDHNVPQGSRAAAENERRRAKAANARSRASSSIT